MWKHLYPQGTADEHKLTWSGQEDDKDICHCNPEVDRDNKIVQHKPVRE